MTNSGIPGEKAVNAVSRFKRELARVQPDVVLIMEGTNDLDPDTLSPGVQAAAAVETMVQHAKTRGVDPILATIPPQRTARSTEPAVVPYNELIRQVAVRQGVPLVDVYQIINTGLCIGAGSLSLSCLGDDHMHPTIEGYTLIAAGFLQRFIQIYEPGGVGLGFQPRTLSDRLLPPVGRIGWRKFE
jgi:lysophospholipase L1-like esterase